VAWLKTLFTEAVRPPSPLPPRCVPRAPGHVVNLTPIRRGEPDMSGRYPFVEHSALLTSPRNAWHGARRRSRAMLQRLDIQPQAGVEIRREPFTAIRASEVRANVWRGIWFATGQRPQNSPSDVCSLRRTPISYLRQARSRARWCAVLTLRPRRKWNSFVKRGGGSRHQLGFSIWFPALESSGAGRGRLSRGDARTPALAPPVAVITQAFRAAGARRVNGELRRHGGW